LIRDGAIMISKIDDLLDDLGIKKKKRMRQKRLWVSQKKQFSD
jgi:predicted Rossmann fold nucleotide-binding protein DprA/Smf involved in DNA uptake